MCIYILEAWKRRWKKFVKRLQIKRIIRTICKMFAFQPEDISRSQEVLNQDPQTVVSI